MVTCVRPMEPEDIYAVLAIETEANPSPWQASDFSAFLSVTRKGVPAHDATGKPAQNVAGVPASWAGKPSQEVGVPAQEAGGDRRAWVYADPEVRGFLCAVGVSGEAELQAIAVEKSRWGGGVGSTLMEAFFSWARIGGFHALYLEVREGNDRALDFYRRWGFASVGRRPRYYRDNGEAAILMTMALIP